jgi:hypothetical protein
MKFEWKYKYVPEGQLEPDEHNRWLLECYILVNIEEVFPQFKWVIEATGEKFHGVKVAWINQKGTLPGYVPSTVDKFCASIPTFLDAMNIGMSNSYNFFSSNLEELKQIVEANFELTAKVFKNT